MDDGTVSEIWNGIMPQLRQLGLLAAEGAAQEEEPRPTLVFDRQGWSPRRFRELRARGIAVVTEIEGSQAERWPDSEFREAAIPVRGTLGPATLEGCVAEYKLPLGKAWKAREIRFGVDRRVRSTGKGGQPSKPLGLAGKPAQRQRLLSILTTYPGLFAEEVAGLLRSRWTQENFFKHLRAEFGLDTLPEHLVVEVDADA